MKNIHILPTDIPSRLSLNTSGKYHLTNQLYTNSPNFTNQNIYITSDEEIKEGDYYLCKLIMKALKCIGDEYFNNIDEKKIILATDQDLIKDGVQAIDDEFLEWFVKNPSCEEIEVNRDWGYPKIIFPKEDNRTHYLDELPNMDRGVLAKMYEDAVPKLNPKLPYPNLINDLQDIANHLDKMNKRVEKETLEEAAEKYSNGGCWEGIRKSGFIHGAKWQQEQLTLSDEEIDKIAKEHILYNDSKRQWFIEGMKIYRDKIKINK